MMTTIVEQRDQLVREAKKIAQDAKDAGRALSRGEHAAIDSRLTRISELGQKIKASEEGDALFSQVMALGPSGDHHDPNPVPGQPQYLDLGPTGRKAIADRLTQHVVREVEGRKSIVPTGETGLAIPLLPSDPVPLGQAPLNLLSVIPTQQIPAGPVARYLRQTTRQNNAGPVPPGTPKPVSVYGLTPQDVILKVYATLSEPVDRFVVDDAASLARWLTAELVYSVTSAVEADVIAGNDPDGITGMLNTSGIRATAFTGDLLGTLRQAITDLESTGYGDLIFALSPADWQAAELTKAETSGVYVLPSSPVSRNQQTIWNVPVTVVNGLAAGTAALFSRPAVKLYVDSFGMRADVGSPGDQWSRNEVTFRVEGRWDLGVLQPPGVTKIATAEVSP